jgi:hypothetical protein
LGVVKVQPSYIVAVVLTANTHSLSMSILAAVGRLIDTNTGQRVNVENAVSSGAEKCRESGGARVIHDRWRALLRTQSLEALGRLREWSQPGSESYLRDESSSGFRVIFTLT